MIIKVPFVKSSIFFRGKNWCGPIALASLLRYYGDNTNVKKIVQQAKTLNLGTPPRGLAFLCLSRGFKVEYLNEYAERKINRKRYSNKLKRFLKEMNEEKNDKEFIEKCKKFPGYKFIKKRPNLKQIERYIKQNKPVLTYLNIATVHGKEKLFPHYILIVGYDKENFYVHNTYPKNKAYQKISKKIFTKAWHSDGMDPTLIVPYKTKS
jgi:hypothetical protein